MTEFICNDLNGEPIFEGDEVFGYNQSYAVKATHEVGGVTVVEEDHTKPLPVADVPRFKGVAEWCSYMLAYYIKVTELIGEWETEPSSILMGGGHYAYQLSPK